MVKRKVDLDQRQIQLLKRLLPDANRAADRIIRRLDETIAYVDSVLKPDRATPRRRRRSSKRGI